MIRALTALAVVLALAASGAAAAPLPSPLGGTEGDAGPSSAPSGASGPTIATLAGGRPIDARGPEIMLQPTGVAFAPDGTLYAGDAALGVLWAVRDGRASLVAGDGRSCWRLNRTGGEECLDGSEDPGTEPLFGAVLRPGAMAVGPDGAVYLAEPALHRIRRVDLAARRVDTIVGTGEAGYDPAQENMPGLAVTLNSPQHLSFDSAGNLYIADTGNARVRMLSTKGRVTTVGGCTTECGEQLRDNAPLVGTPLANVAASAVGPDGLLYVATPTAVFRAVDGRWRRVAGDSFSPGGNPGQGENGPAANARFASLSGLAFSADGDLNLLDRGWNRVSRIKAPVSPTSTVTHVAGCSCGAGSNRAGWGGDGGAATAALLDVAAPGPARAGLAVSPTGQVALADSGNRRVRQVGADGRMATVAGSGGSGPAQRMHTYADFAPSQFAGAFSGDGGAGTAAQLFGPIDVAVDPQGNTYVLDRYSHRVRRIDGETGVITTVAGSGCAGAGCNPPTTGLGDGLPATQAFLRAPSSIALDRTGTQLYIADRWNYRVRQVNLGTQPVTVYPGSSAPLVIPPGGIHTVVGDGTHCLYMTPCGDGSTATTATVGTVEGLAVDAKGSLHLADATLLSVRAVDPATGVITTIAGSARWRRCDDGTTDPVPAALALLCIPMGIAFGPDGALYVTEVGDTTLGTGWIPEPHAARIRRIDPPGPTVRMATIVVGQGRPGIAGDGGPARAAQLRAPRDLAIAADGTMWIADTGNGRIRRVTPDGVIDTVAGRGESDGEVLYGCADDGDGGPARHAGMCTPTGIALAPDGSVVVATHIDNRVRVLRSP